MRLLQNPTKSRSHSVWVAESNKRALFGGARGPGQKKTDKSEIPWNLVNQRQLIYCYGCAAYIDQCDQNDNFYCLRCVKQREANE